MAYFQGQYGHYAQSGYGNQNYPQYNNYSNTGTSDAQTNYGYSNVSGSSGQQSQASSQSYSASGQQYNFGYSSAGSTASTTTSTTTSQQGTSYQQFSNLWYNQATTAQPNQSQQSTSQQQQQQQTGNRANQQYSAAAYQAQMNQYYQQQSAYNQQQQQQYQQGSQVSAQQYKQPDKPQQPSGAQQSQPASSTSLNQSSGEWSGSSQQRTSEGYSAYSNQAKPPASQSWSGYSQQQGGKDWASQATSYQQQQQPTANKNGHQGGGGGGGDYNYSQQPSTIQQQPQMYPQQQQRNYPYQQQQQQQQNFPYQQGMSQRVGGNLPDMNRGLGGERNQAGGSYGPNHDSRGNWNTGPTGPPNAGNSGGPGEWGAGGGWGDWSGSRNNNRRGGNDDGPHIPPFPQAWQMRGMGPQQPPLPPGGGRMEQNRGNWSGGNNWKQGWDNQVSPKPPGNPNRFSRGDGQQNNRFQNSGRYSPNSRQSRGSAEKSNRELWTPGDAKRGIKDKPPKSKDFPDVDKPIQATEIKSYLYAWLGVRRMRPLYDIHPVGERPDLTFRCELRVNGYKFVGVGEAASKKDAQTDAAWSFAEFLVRQGMLKKADLPPKLKDDDEATDDFGTVKEYGQQKHARPKPNRNRAPRNPPKGPVPLMSIVTSPIGNIPPFPAFEHPSEAWGPPRRGPPGPWTDGPGGPWRGGHRDGRVGFPDHWKQRDMEEDHWLEEQQHPEDIFISRMIMNQQEAAMARRLESKPGEWTSVSPARSRNVTTLDDRHVMAKHAAIYPHEEELKAVHQMVTIAERALKALSDQFVDEDHPITENDDDVTEEEEEEVKKEQADEDKKEDADKAEKKSKIQILKRPKKRPRRFPDTRPRVLCAVNRVGTLAKGLLIHEDLNVCLVLLCGVVPTKSLLQRIIKHLPAKLDNANKDFKYELKEGDVGFEIVGHFDVTVKLSVALTSTSLKSSSGKERQEKEKKKESDDVEKMDQGEEKPSEEKNEGEEEDPEKKPTDDSDSLPKPLLLGALAKLRHAKWFQARASQQDGGVVITRILRNMKMRNPIWSPLTDWALENLLYISLSTSTEHMSPGDAIRRFFEVVAGGVLLKDRSGIQDPCEKEEVDVLDCCTDQQLEDMTRHAQNSLLKIAFRRVHEVLDMEKIAVVNRVQQLSHTTSSATAPGEEEVEEREGARKRRLEHNSSDSLAESPKRSLTDEEDTDTQPNLAELTISDPNKANIITPIQEVAEEKITDTSEAEEKEETKEEEKKNDAPEPQDEPMDTDQ